MPIPHPNLELPPGVLDHHPGVELMDANTAIKHLRGMRLERQRTVAEFKHKVRTNGDRQILDGMIANQQALKVAIDALAKDPA